MQAPGPGHGGQGQPFATDVAEDLKNHEAEQEEVETGTDACNDDECHLKQQQSRINQRLKKQKQVQSFRFFAWRLISKPVGVKLGRQGNGHYL